MLLPGHHTGNREMACIHVPYTCRCTHLWQPEALQAHVLCELSMEACFGAFPGGARKVIARRWPRCTPQPAHNWEWFTCCSNDHSLPVCLAHVGDPSPQRRWLRLSDVGRGQMRYLWRAPGCDSLGGSCIEMQLTQHGRLQQISQR